MKLRSGNHFLSFGTAFGVLLSATPALAQNKPFPQTQGYAFGFVSGTTQSGDALAAYSSWRSNYLKTDCGGGSLRVEFNSPPGSTVSEGMGYGMVLSVYHGDRPAFDGLWSFVQKNRNAQGLMGWKVTCGGFDQSVGGGSSATDGDEDIGFALVAAVAQWGDAYRQPALDYLATLKRVDFKSCPTSGLTLAAAGDWGGGCDFSNTSYWAPAYYRVFAEFSGDSFWTKAANDAVHLYIHSFDRSTGLAPNEVDEFGKAHGPSVVDYNGCRTPWRMVLDYLWYGTPGAYWAATAMTKWVDSFGIANLVDGYNVDGSRSASGMYTQQNPWVGGFAAGAMALSPQAAAAFGADLKSIGEDEGGYYGSSLRSLYMLVLSGNFWKPGPY